MLILFLSAKNQNIKCQIIYIDWPWSTSIEFDGIYMLSISTRQNQSRTAFMRRSGQFIIHADWLVQRADKTINPQIIRFMQLTRVDWRIASKQYYKFEIRSIRETYWKPHVQPIFQYYITSLCDVRYIHQWGRLFRQCRSQSPITVRVDFK